MGIPFLTTPFLTVFGSFRGRFWVDLGSVWGRLWLDLGSIWGRLWVELGSIWGRFGISLGSIWGRFGVDLVNLGEIWAFAEIMSGKVLSGKVAPYMDHVANEGVRPSPRVETLLFVGCACVLWASSSGLTGCVEMS